MSAKMTVDVLVFLRDGLLTVAVALHDRLGHQRQQQAVVFLALFGEQLFLDLQIPAHLVESDSEIADFVARGDRHRDVVVAGADLLRAGLQSPDRPHEYLGDQHRGHADDENHRRGRQYQRPGE